MKIAADIGNRTFIRFSFRFQCEAHITKLLAGAAAQHDPPKQGLLSPHCLELFALA